MSNKPTVLILCTGNSCRSHIAEGILRQAAVDFVDVQSAGSRPAGYVHPKAIEVMKEIGIGISSHTSKHMNEFLDRKVDTVITVCGNADQACPMFPGQVNRYHWGFDDPAHAKGTEEEAECRRVRDQIKLVFEAYAAGLREGENRNRHSSRRHPPVEKTAWPGTPHKGRKISHEYEEY
jgi:arsenate reductase (thioredoxin)